MLNPQQGHQLIELSGHAFRHAITQVTQHFVVWKQARILEDIANPALFWCQVDALFNVIQHPIVEHDAAGLRPGQAAYRVDQRGFPGSGDTKDGGDPAGWQGFVKGQAVLAQSLGKIEFQHGYFPIRSRLRRASHSDTSSEAIASTMERMQRRAAAPSPPGV